jgi:putative endonuclease
MWFVYALRSFRDQRLYVGMSSDLRRRVEEHNRGYNRSTKSRAPFELIYFEECGSRADARKRERFFKSGKGREFLRMQCKAGGGNSTVESRSSKAMVAGSNPVPRSMVSQRVAGEWNLASRG